MPEAAFVQVRTRAVSGVDPINSFTTHSRKYRPIIIRSNGSTGQVAGVERGVETTRIWLTKDSVTSTLTPRDRILWSGVEYDIASIPILQASRRHVCLDISRR